MSGTSYALGTLERDLPLLTPIGAVCLWTEILGHLPRKPKSQLRFVDGTLIKVH